MRVTENHWDDKLKEKVSGIFSRIVLKELIAELFHILYSFMHWSNNKIVSVIFVILWFMFIAISRAFWGLGSFMSFMVFILVVELLFLAYSASFGISGRYDRLSADIILGFDERKLEIGGFKQIYVFWSLSDWGGGQSVLVPKNKVKRMKRKVYWRSIPFSGLKSFLMIWFFHFK